MKRCSCEHWQTCPSCYPQGFDEHGARKPVEIHSSREELRREITTLREQVEKLTKERDIKEHCITQFELEDLRMKEQLAALAEQNAKLRKVLLRLACLGNGDQYGNSIGNCIAQEALSLPDLATPVLNRIRAEGMRMAAEILIDPMDRAAAQKICAQADELEKTNG